MSHGTASLPNQSIRRVYTSQNQQLPTQLSYQSIKLANFIQLQLTDLWDSLQQINQQNFKNQLKESLSRSYNVFHEMKKLYNDLGMNFLYSQSKKLISSYGVIFVYLIEKLQKYQKNQQQIKDKKQSTPKTYLNSFQQKIIKNIQNLKQRKTDKQTKKYKRTGGIHLFNQSYARCMDYDVQYFRQMRDKLKETQQTEQQQLRTKIEQQRKFKKQIQEELNDFSYLKVDGQQLHMFLNRHRNSNQEISKVSLEEQLQKISVFFKQSQHQALQFLRKQKNLQSFHQLTQGFNLIVTQCQTSKANRLFQVKDKIKQIFEYIQSKIKIYLQMISQKQKEIQKIKQLNNKKIIYTIDSQTQTFGNFDEQVKQLYRKIVTAQMMNEQLKTYIAKMSLQDRKQITNLTQQICNKESNIRQLKQTIQQKNNYLLKIQRKFKIMHDSQKNKNITNPIQYFTELSDQMKKYFIQQLKEQGFLFTHKNDQRHISVKRNNHSKIQPGTKNVQLFSGGPNINDYIITNQSKIENSSFHLRKRESSIFKKTSQLSQNNSLNKQNDIKTSKHVENQRKSIGTINTIIQQQSSLNSTIQVEKSRKSSINQNKQNDQVKKKQNQRQNTFGLSGFKSKKIIPLKTIRNENAVEKVRVFDIQQKTPFNYSQNSFQIQKSQNNMSNDNSPINSVKDMKKSNKQITKKTHNHNQHQNQQNLSQDFQNVPQQKKQQMKKLYLDKMSKKYETPKIIQNLHQDSIQIMQKKQKKRKLKKQKKRLLKNQQNTEKYDQNNQLIDYNIEVKQCSQSQDSQSSNQAHQQQNSVVKQNRQSRYSRYSIISSFNLAIPNIAKVSLINSSTNINQNSKQQQTINQTQQYNQNSVNKLKLPNKIGQNIAKQRQSLKQQKQNMKTTIKKLKNIKQHESMHQDRQLQYRKTKPNVKPISINNKSINQSKSIISDQIQSANIKQNKSVSKQNGGLNNNNKMYSSSNTFHRQTSRNNKKNKISQIFNNKQNNTIFEGNQTMTAFNRDMNNNSSKKNRKGNHRSSSKFSNLIRMSQHEATHNYRSIIEEQFGEQQIVSASRLASTVQQFKQHVMRLHQSKCGNNCKHLQRYLEIFERLRNQNYKSKRQTIKMHIQNIHDKININKDQYLPAINKK